MLSEELRLGVMGETKVSVPSVIINALVALVAIAGLLANICTLAKFPSV